MVVDDQDGSDHGVVASMWLQETQQQDGWAMMDVGRCGGWR
jgi:hypothetical protein